MDAKIRRANRIPQASCSRLTLPEEQIRLDYRNVLKSPSTPRLPKGDVERDFSGPLQATPTLSQGRCYDRIAEITV